MTVPFEKRDLKYYIGQGLIGALLALIVAWLAFNFTPIFQDIWLKRVFEVSVLFIVALLWFLKLGIAHEKSIVWMAIGYLILAPLFIYSSGSFGLQLLIQVFLFGAVPIIVGGLFGQIKHHSTKLFIAGLLMSAILLISIACLRVFYPGMTKSTASGIPSNSLVINQPVAKSLPHSYWMTFLPAEGVQFQYPQGWLNENNLLSPQPIVYYEIGSDNAPISYSIIAEDKLGDSGVMREASSDERYSPDSWVTISGSLFKKYDLIDRGSYEGESAGRVVIYLSPRLYLPEGRSYLSVRWEEKPGLQVVQGSNPEIFEEIVSTIKLSQAILSAPLTETPQVTNTNLSKYINAKYGYSIQYPKNFTIYTAVNQDKQEVVLPTLSSERVAFTDKKEMLFCCEPLVTSVEVIHGPIDIKNWRQYGDIPDYRIKSQGQITFAGRDAYEVRGTLGIDSTGTRLIIISGDQYSFVITQGNDGEPWEALTNSFNFL